MSFLAVLRCGATPEVEAKHFVHELLTQSANTGNLCLLLVENFVNDLLKAIGLPCNITGEQLATCENLPWPEKWRSYIFQYNGIVFAALERFLLELCKVVQDEEEAFITAQTLDELPVNSPLDWFLQLLTIWCNAYENLQQLEKDMPTRYFDEPFARINYPLFKGMHTIRKEYASRVPLLDKICKRFYHSALNGLFYKECHGYVAAGLLSLLETDFGYCSAFDDDCLVFVYEVLSVEQPKHTHARLFKCLTQLLPSLEARTSTQVYRKLLNFLISVRMLEVYFYTLTKDKSKNILLAVLEFVKTLQGQLLDLECLSQAFAESILGNVLHRDKSVQGAAAELYIIVAQRKLNNDDAVLKHILEYYFCKMSTTESLVSYVDALWSHFPYMQSLEKYVEILQNKNTEFLMQCFVAHFCVVCYQEIFRNLDKYQQQIVFMLQNVPIICKCFEEQSIKGILLQIVKLTDLDLLQPNCDTVNTVLLNFENYAIEELEKCKSVNYSYVLNLFTQFFRVVEQTKNFHKMERLAINIYMKYTEIENTLKRLDTQSKMPNDKLLADYSDVLQKLNVLLKLSYNVLDFQLELFLTLSTRFIGKPQFYGENMLLIDAYAMELMVSCVLKLDTDDDLTTKQKSLITARVQQIENQLLNYLCDLNVSSVVNILRHKTHFNCLVALYDASAQNSKLIHLKLQLRPYHVLVQTLKLCCFELKLPSHAYRQKHMEDMHSTEVHPQRLVEYQKLMLRKFALLHACQHIEIPSAVAWKLCMLYRLPSHKFDEELDEFMYTLATNHLKNYTHIIAVSVYNLYNQQPALRDDTALAAIRAHKSFIDKLPSSLAPANINACVVLAVLDIVQRVLLKTPPVSGKNRLAVLKHLDHFTANLNIDNTNILPDVVTQAKLLRNHLLNAVEQMRLTGYLYALEKYSRTSNGK